MRYEKRTSSRGTDSRPAAKLTVPFDHFVRLADVPAATTTHVIAQAGLEIAAPEIGGYGKPRPALIVQADAYPVPNRRTQPFGRAVS